MSKVISIYRENQSNGDLPRNPVNELTEEEKQFLRDEFDTPEND